MCFVSRFSTLTLRVLLYVCLPFVITHLLHVIIDTITIVTTVMLPFLQLIHKVKGQKSQFLDFTQQKPILKYLMSNVEFSGGAK